jgi:hypothetical protein
LRLLVYTKPIPSLRMYRSIANIWLILSLTGCILMLQGHSQPLAAQELRKVENVAFGRGEKLTYRVVYNSRFTGNVYAGDASLEIQPTTIMIGGRPAMHIVGLGSTRGVFNLFFRVDNRYETYIDERAIAPLMFIRRIHEGSYRKHQTVSFNQRTNIATSNTATVEVVPYVQDIISAFFYARTLDISNAKPGDTFPVDFFLDDSVYVTHIEYDGREQITTRQGTFNTLRFRPMVLTGSVFSQPYPMTMWISDDRNKIPVLIESGLKVGSIRMELSDYAGLRNPLYSRLRD